MPYDIMLGRDESDRKKFGKKGLIFLGRQWVKMGPYTSLSNNIYMDVAKAHVVLIAGKRGSGKSYSMGVMAEEMAKMPKEVAENLSVVFLDTMGIFWTMKYENEKDKDLLKEWGLKPEGLDIAIFTPKGHFEDYKKKGMPVDFPFAIKPNELSAGDWASVFGIQMTDPVGVLIERVINNLRESKKDYSIKDIIQAISSDKKSDKQARDAAENRFIAADGWGLFGKEGTKIKDIAMPGRASVIDVSAYQEAAGVWSIRGLVIGMIARKLMEERMAARKEEEIHSVKEGTKLFGGKMKEKMPLVWIFIDEAHEFLPKAGNTPATAALVQLLREGRQPGISLALATQQPGEIHKDVLTQSDIVIGHRLTAKPDIEALNTMMQSYLLASLQKYMNDLPKLKGSAIILDDNSERIYPMRVRPRFSWHGGEAPSAVEVKKKLEF